MMKALFNPATGVVLSWTPELAKRRDLVEVMVNEKYEVVDSGGNGEVVVVADDDKQEPIPPKKKTKKSK